MKQTLTKYIRELRPISYVVAAAIVFVAGLPLINGGHAIAATQLSNRSIQLSDSSPSGGTITSGVGSGANVTYKFAFTTATAASSVVIDFCANDPIIGDTCSAPTGMSVTGAAIDATGTDPDITSSGWSITNSNSPNPVIKLAKGSGLALSAGVAHTFDLTGITNPSTVNSATLGSFYARIYTFSNATFGSYSNAGAAATSGFVDYGGVALSITNVITITARVQETLTFCVTSADPAVWTTTGDCGDTAVTGNLPNLILGHGTPTAVLDSQNVDYGNIWTQLSTNATHGAVINMHNSNTSCGGLSADNGTTCAIPPINAGANTGPVALTAGTAAFGVAINSYVPSPLTGAAAIGALTPTSPYYTAAHYTFSGNAPTDVYYGMDNTTSSGLNSSFPAQSSYNGAVTSTYGSTVATTTSPVYHADDRYTFAATAALTTPAGIYTANLSLIATGTF